MPLPTELFPYNKPRRFQDEFMQVAYTSDRLLASVPTGIGKSVASLCSFLADRQAKEKIVVLTRTKSQAEIFLREAKAISDKTGKAFLTVQIKSKLELCPIFRNDDIGYEEFLQLCKLKQDCSYRRLFKEKQDEIIYLAEALALGEDRKKILSYGCPHLVNFELAKFARVIIAAYQYMLNPFLRNLFLGRLKLGYDELLLIVDEAHNLQSLDIISKSLSERTLKLAQKEVDYNFSNIEKLFRCGEGQVNFEEFISRDDVEKIYALGVEILQRKLMKGRKVSYTYRVAAFFDSAFRLLGDDNWIFFRKGSSLHLKPVLPGEVFSSLKQSRKLLLMSGTLEPIEIYKTLLDLEEAEEYSLPNIYRNSLLYLGIKKGLNSSLVLRKAMGQKLWKSYAREIEKIASAAGGITLAFLPSYDIMRQVSEWLEATVEPKDNRDAEKLRKKAIETGKGIILGVAGGKFSEGVEFTRVEEGIRKSLVKAVVIAGLPFPAPDSEMELRQKIYDKKFGPGKSFIFLSVLPMINRVMQAAGRAVRSERDKAGIVIIDDRTEYLRYFPEDFKQCITFVEPEEISGEIRDFLRE